MFLVNLREGEWPTDVTRPLRNLACSLKQASVGVSVVPAEEGLRNDARQVGEMAALPHGRTAPTNAEEMPRA